MMRAPRWIAAPWLMLVASCSGGGDGDNLVRVQSAGYFNPTIIDFGVQPIGGAVRRPVRFTNASGEQIQVREVAFEPAVNAYALKLEGGGAFRNSVLSRNESRALEVEFGPDREGVITTMLLLRTETLEIPLELTGTGRRVEPARFEVSPTSVAFADVIVGERAVQPVTVTNRGELFGRIARAPSMPPYGVQGAGGTSIALEVAPGATVSLEIDFAPTSAGRFERELYVETEGGTRTSIAVGGTAVDAGTLACDTASLAFGDVIRGVTERRTVRCTSTGAYRLQSVASSSAEIVVEGVSPGPGALVNTLSFDVVYRGAGIAHDSNGVITIRSSHGDAITIDVSASTVAPPAGEADLRVSMAWTTAVDLDLHFVRQGGLPFMVENDCHWEVPTIDWNVLGDESDDPFLDGDFLTGPATEYISMIEGRNGRYEVYAFYNDHAGGAPPASATTVTIQLRGQAPATFVRTLSVCGTIWHVGTIDHGANPPAFLPVDAEASNYQPFADCAQ